MSNMAEGNWTLGVLVGIPISALFIIGLTGIGLAIILASRRTAKPRADGTHHPFHFWAGEFIPLGWFSLGIAIVWAGIAAVAYIPYGKDYHYWTPVTGAVEEIDSRLISSGDGMAERYVFTIDGQPYGVDDTRAATVDEGDRVALLCKKEWQWQAADGWGCRWGGDAQASAFTINDEERGLINMHPELVKEQTND